LLKYSQELIENKVSQEFITSLWELKFFVMDTEKSLTKVEKVKNDLSAEYNQDVPESHDEESQFSRNRSQGKRYIKTSNFITCTLYIELIQFHPCR